MHEHVKPDIWHGRIDEYESGETTRWHQQVESLEVTESTAPQGIVLFGICCDEGVKRNQGRIGARKGPNAIRRALASFPWHLETPLYDAGNLHCHMNDLEELSNSQADWVYTLLCSGHFPLILGGGHEIAYGSFCGLQRFLAPQQAGPIGIINFDAHFDLREDIAPSSGTSFLQIAQDCESNQIPFHYACLGVSETANTLALFDRAESLNVAYLRDEDLVSWKLDEAYRLLEEFITPLSALYLTIDLDVLPAETMPGVSATAAPGVSLTIIEDLIDRVKLLAGDKLKLADIAEYNPELDIDNHGAKVCARLCHRIIRPSAIEL